MHNEMRQGFRPETFTVGALFNVYLWWKHFFLVVAQSSSSGKVWFKRLFDHSSASACTSMTGWWEELCNIIMECNLLIYGGRSFPVHATSPKVGKKQALKQGRLSLLPLTMSLKDSPLFHSALPLLCFSERWWKNMKSICPSVQSNYSGCPLLSSRKLGKRKWYNDRMSWPASRSFSWIDKVFTSAGKPPNQKTLCRCQPHGFWKDVEIVLHIHLFLKKENKTCLFYLIGGGCRDNKVFSLMLLLGHSHLFLVILYIVDKQIISQEQN